MSFRSLMSIIALTAFLPVAVQAGTNFRGSATVNMTVLLKSAPTSSQKIYCSYDLSGSDTDGGSYKAHLLIEATEQSSLKYTCKVAVPYDWTNPYASGLKMTIQAIYTALVVDSSVPLQFEEVTDTSGNNTPLVDATEGASSTYNVSLEMY
jgi:hypothetical protein